ncbi:MAG TPA: hypothetical protein PKM65_20475 [Spirochaetota bacterium]|nr:hypothetical protein [Spirochaetota bacterium]
MGKGGSFTVSVEVELDLELEIEDYMPPSPGRLSGPPEDCYPPEDSEFDIAKAYAVFPERVAVVEGGVIVRYENRKRRVELPPELLREITILYDGFGEVVDEEASELHQAARNEAEIEMMEDRG